MRAPLRGLALCLLALGIACQPASRPVDWNGMYRASLQLPGGELPFGLELKLEDGAGVAWLINGTERVKVDETSLINDVLTLRMPGLENTLTLHREGRQLRGELYMVKAKGRRQHIPFTALPAPRARFFPQVATPGGDVSGRWATEFTEDSGRRYVAVGEFIQHGDEVTGTFLTPTGDYRYLHGELREGRLYLSTFNGGHAFLFHGAVSGDGMTGEYWSGLASHERFTAHRDASASLGQSTAATVMKSPAQRFTFSFPDSDGATISLADARFQGKVVIVTLVGSWCPNCHDEARFLAPYYQQHRAEGLEIVGLMFEQLETLPEMRDAVNRFRARLGVDYPLLLAGTADRDDAARRLPQLNGVFAWPTTLFIDRKGIVRHIHTGFSGPATGAHYTALVQDFDQRTRALLTESP